LERATGIEPAWPAWKVGGAGTGLPGLMFLLADRVERVSDRQ
jgi:hypothetical protein